MVFPLLDFTGGLPEPGRHNVYYQRQEAEVFMNLIQTVTPFEFHRPAPDVLDDLRLIKLHKHLENSRRHLEVHPPEQN